MSRTTPYEELLVAAYKAVKGKLLSIPRHPYREVMDRLKGKEDPTVGVYIIFDDRGESCYVGTSAGLHDRLNAHLNFGGYLVEELLGLAGLARKVEHVHQCACQTLIQCPAVDRVVNQEERERALASIRARILDTYTVAILEHDDRSTEALGRRELERLVQYVLVPRHGYMPHRTEGQITIREHIAANPTPRKAESEPV